MMLKSSKIFEELWWISKRKLNAKLWNVLKNRHFMFIKPLHDLQVLSLSLQQKHLASLLKLLQQFRKKT